jgi:transcriptional regulator with XRE-family HTH domain
MSGEDVRQLREQAGMTQQELADYLGLRHRSQVRHLESGRTQVVGAKLRLLEDLYKKSKKKREKFQNRVDGGKQTR